MKCGMAVLDIILVFWLQIILFYSHCLNILTQQCLWNVSVLIIFLSVCVQSTLIIINWNKEKYTFLLDVFILQFIRTFLSRLQNLYHIQHYKTSVSWENNFLNFLYWILECIHSFRWRWQNKEHTCWIWIETVLCYLSLGK